MAVASQAVGLSYLYKFINKNGQRDVKSRSSTLAAYLIYTRHKRHYRSRSIWVYPSDNSYWNTIVSSYSDERFLRKFRMGRNTFSHLCDAVKPYIAKENTQMRLSISVDRRVAIALSVLKSNCDYWSVAEAFGVGKCTVGNILWQFVEAVVDNLYATSVKFPETHDEVVQVVRGFHSKWTFPGCLGAMDGCHIPITAPKEHAADYFNYKHFHSIILLAVVDHEYCFRSVTLLTSMLVVGLNLMGVYPAHSYANVGRPGRSGDAAVFQSSGLYNKGSDVGLAPTGLNVHTISDAAFPLLPWVMKPYPVANDMQERHRHFNYRLSRARMVVENCFGRLKGRWRILSKRCELHVDRMRFIVMTCIYLHNLCESRRDLFVDSWAVPEEEFQGIANNQHEQEIPRQILQEANQKRNDLADALCNDVYFNGADD